MWHSTCTFKPVYLMPQNYGSFQMHNFVNLREVLAAVFENGCNFGTLPAFKVIYCWSCHRCLIVTLSLTLRATYHVFYYLFWWRIYYKFALLWLMRKIQKFALSWPVNSCSIITWIIVNSLYPWIFSSISWNLVWFRTTKNYFKVKRLN